MPLPEARVSGDARSASVGHFCSCRKSWRILVPSLVSLILMVLIFKGGWFREALVTRGPVAGTLGSLMAEVPVLPRDTTSKPVSPIDLLWVW